MMLNDVQSQDIWKADILQEYMITAEQHPSAGMRCYGDVRNKERSLQ